MACLYDDEYVLVTDHQLIIKNVTFPAKKEKHILLESITIVWFEEQSTCKSAAMKMWGKSSTDVYWALDVKRCLPLASNWNVIVDYGQQLKFGFTVGDGDEFMKAMRRNLHYNVIIVNNIDLK